MSVDGWPLPRWAHLPGVTHDADHASLLAAKAAVPARFAGPLPADHPALAYGLRLHECGLYWEAHEVLEAVWLATPLNGRDRLAVRAAIQLANAGLKKRLGRERAVARLLAEVVTLLQDVGPPGSTDGAADRLDWAALRLDVLAIGSGCATGTWPCPRLRSG